MQLTHPCDIESRRATPERRAAWHRDCPEPGFCSCPAHQDDTGPVKTPEQVLAARWPTPTRFTKNNGR